MQRVIKICGLSLIFMVSLAILTGCAGTGMDGEHISGSYEGSIPSFVPGDTHRYYVSLAFDGAAFTLTQDFRRIYSDLLERYQYLPLSWPITIATEAERGNAEIVDEIDGHNVYRVVSAGEYYIYDGEITFRFDQGETLTRRFVYTYDAIYIGGVRFNLLDIEEYDEEEGEEDNG